MPSREKKKRGIRRGPRGTYAAVDAIRRKILDMPDKTAEEIAEMIGYTAGRVNQIRREARDSRGAVA